MVADLVESNARLREEISALSDQLDELQAVEGGGALLQSLVDEVNYLRIVNGQVAVSGPGIEVVIEGDISVLDLHDLINELRNAGAEALALNGEPDRGLVGHQHRWAARDGRWPARAAALPLAGHRRSTHAGGGPAPSRRVGRTDPAASAGA